MRTRQALALAPYRPTGRLPLSSDQTSLIGLALRLTAERWDTLAKQDTPFVRTLREQAGQARQIAEIIDSGVLIYSDE